MFRHLPGSLPSLFQRPDPTPAPARLSRSREALSSRQNGFLDFLLRQRRSPAAPKQPTAAPSPSSTSSTASPARPFTARPPGSPTPSNTSTTSTASSTSIPPTSEFHRHFTEHRLDTLSRRLGGSALSRWIHARQPSHIGFDRVLEAARALARTAPADAYRPARRLQLTLQQYADGHETRWQREIAKGGSAAAIATEKQQVIQEMRRGIEHLFAEHFVPDPVQVFPSDTSARRVAAEQRAAFLSRHVGAGAAMAGSSEVRLIRSPEQRVVYAFKPILGESPQNFVPLGGGALREKLCHLFNEEVRNTTQLDFGFPSVEIVSQQGQYGALIEGVPGRNMDADALATRVEPSEQGLDELQRTRRLWTVQAGRIDASQIQKVMLANLAMGNVDLKWGNLMMDNRGGCRPIDGGSAFPTRVALADICERGIPPDALCDSPAGTPLEAADEPFDPWLREQFLRIDADRMEAVLLKQRAELLGRLPYDFMASVDDGDAESMLDVASVKAGVNSLRLTQDILRELPDCGMRTLARLYINRLSRQVPPSDITALKQAMEAHVPSSPKALRQLMEAFREATAGDNT